MPNRKTSSSKSTTDNGKSTFERQYEFINAQDARSQRLQRVHVTLEYNRERRWRQVNDLKAEIRRTGEDTPKDFVVSVSRLEPEQPTSTLRSSNQSSFAHSQLAFLSTANDVQEVHDDVVWRPPCPRSHLGAGRVDPFNSCHIDASKEVHQPVDNCTSIYPWLERYLNALRHRHDTVPFASTMSNRLIMNLPVRDLFQMYVLDTAAFHGMLLHSARSIGKFRGVGETREALEHTGMPFE